jgi:predicted O-methyltransferase YrrM
MSESAWLAVDAYLEPLVHADDALELANRDAARAGLPSIQVSPAEGRLLQVLARVQGAQRILEVGTLAGYSTICLARGLTGDAHLTTLEISPGHAEVASANVARAGLADVVEIRVGPALESLAALAAENVAPFDMAFIDADKPSNTAYLDWALRLCRPGAMIVVDNVVRRGAVADADSSDPSVLGAREVIERVAAEPSLMATVIQTVGAKGYDGMLLVRVPD